MPNYDFLCGDCQHKFSASVPIKERENVRCPVCQSANVKQRFTGFFFTRSGGNGIGGGSGSSCSRTSCSGCSGC